MTLPRLTAPRLLRSGLLLGAAAAAVALGGVAAPAIAVTSAPAASAAADTCSNGFGNPNTCTEAVTWAKHRLNTYHSSWVGACDHIVAAAYGWDHSGSTTAVAHWNAIPATYRHDGDHTSVPAGALAFFSGGSSGAGHVMLSLGDGTFASTDIGKDGSYDPGWYGSTTVPYIQQHWNEHYLGWTQPYFATNH